MYAIRSYYGLSQWTGLWTGVVSGDFNEDGYMDLAAANIGLNTKYTAPAVVYAGNVDGDGDVDIIEAYYVGDTLYPRITSYNVCYTKLLRVPADALPLFAAGSTVFGILKTIGAVDEIKQTGALGTERAAVDRMIRVAFDVHDLGLGVGRSITSYNFV